ncbi:hypothetical protein ABW20_dc0106790 [Dactylellina cionopaga]|nr:hypothetical protein ABW20_dc0106790 [Dactylellina cionopaga]
MADPADIKTANPEEQIPTPNKYNLEDPEVRRRLIRKASTLEHLNRSAEALETFERTESTAQQKQEDLALDCCNLGVCSIVGLVDLSRLSAAFEGYAVIFAEVWYQPHAHLKLAIDIHYEPEGETEPFSDSNCRVRIYQYIQGELGEALLTSQLGEKNRIQDALEKVREASCTNG